MNRMAVKKPSRMKADEYVEWARGQSHGRYELIRGEVVKMAAEKVRHALVKQETAFCLREAIRQAGLDCQVFPDGVSVLIGDDSCYEPDCAVQCGEKPDLDKVNIESPLILAEVLSPSTAVNDMTVKLADYFRLASLVHYLIIDAERHLLIHHRRHQGRIITAIIHDGPLSLDPPGLEIEVEKLFVD